MFNILKKYKFDLLWFLLTFIFIIAINISYMYSRDKTLNTVEFNQFKLFANLMHTFSINEEKFLTIADSLTIIPSSSSNKTKQALFHIAMITPNACVENGRHPRNKPFLCSAFQTTNQLKNFFKQVNISKDMNFLEIRPEEVGINETRYRSYLLQKRNNTNKWIVAKKRYHRNDTDFQKLIFFLSNRYIQTTSWKSKFYYTRFSTISILLVSIFLWILFKLKERKNLKEYQNLKEKSNTLKIKLKDFDNQYNQLKEELYILEEEVEGQELQLISQNQLPENEKKKIIEKIRETTMLQSQKYDLLQKIKKEIVYIEAENELVENLINEKRTTLNTNRREIEYNKYHAEIMNLKQLWRHEPTWTERRNIESHVSLISSNLPFTITQAFLAFEQHIEKEIEYNFEKDKANELLKKNLIEKINIISKAKNFTNNERNIYHNVRKARNKWVHSSIYPSQDIFNNLLNILEQKNITPLL